ncbi:EamA-like transporter family protein [Candidatus Gugararchaeum adminiculabundum]|nr:EamA-like transporter family protein [Candidatus Gugararchaeum adminiculabundum]
MGDENKGMMLALVTAVVSGISVFINGIAVKTADPVVYTTLKNVGVVVLLLAMVIGLAKMSAFRKLKKKQWGTLALIGMIGGSIPFALFFWGLKLGGAEVSSFLYRSLFIFAGVFGYFILKEKAKTRDVAAAVIILAGNALLISGSLTFGIGQILVLAATVMWALEYTISRKMVQEIDASIVMVSRMLFGSMVLIGFTLANGSLTAVSVLNTEMLSWLALTSVLLFAFVVSWYSALRYLPVLKATAIFSLGGIVTALLNFAVLGKLVPSGQEIGFLLILAGVIAVSKLDRALELVRAKNIEKAAEEGLGK